MKWSSIGHALGKGLGWLLRHPEAVKGAIDALKTTKDRKEAGK